MEKVRYMISDAASIVNVESHVLRYWEEELELVIPRNEMGHRYYTKENIDDFMKIKELKEKGYQLKAIRMIIHNGNKDYQFGEEDFEQSQILYKGPLMMTPKEDERSVLDNTDRMAQFTELMTEIVGKAITANNEQLSKCVSEEVGEQVIKELDYLMREREEAEEDRFRKLDEAIRENLKKPKKKGIFKKKEKEKKEE